MTCGSQGMYSFQSPEKGLMVFCLRHSMDIIGLAESDGITLTLDAYSGFEGCSYDLDEIMRPRKDEAKLPLIQCLVDQLTQIAWRKDGIIKRST